MASPFTSFKIEDRSMVSFLKREMHNLAKSCGFPDKRAAETDIIVAELTSNLIKFAGSGELLYRATYEGEAHAIEIYCTDEGTGIENVHKFMADGVSTSNTMGSGLGAIARLSDLFEIYSARHRGTVQYVRIAAQPRQRPPVRREPFEWAAMQVNCPNETVCGDGYLVKQTKSGFQVLVGDGLGHGAHAHEAVEEAVRAFRVSRENDPAEVIREIHAAVRKTRGLVATVAAADPKAGTWRLCGVGNISTRIALGAENKNYSPYNGIIGNNIPRTLNSAEVPYLKSQLLVMHSDGVRTRWKLGDYPGLQKESPRLIAATLYQRNTRGNDDATVFAGKVN